MASAVRSPGVTRWVLWGCANDADTPPPAKPSRPKSLATRTSGADRRGAAVSQARAWPWCLAREKQSDERGSRQRPKKPERGERLGVARNECGPIVAPSNDWCKPCFCARTSVSALRRSLEGLLKPGPPRRRAGRPLERGGESDARQRVLQRLTQAVGGGPRPLLRSGWAPTPRATAWVIVAMVGCAGGGRSVARGGGAPL